MGVSPDGLLAPCGFALEAAERFLSSVIMSAHSFINPKASPCKSRHQPVMKNNMREETKWVRGRE